jgi:DNA repair protein RecO
MLVQAVVIKKIPVREYDQLVTLYTRELGKTLAVAKSALKRSSVQALHLDEGNLIQCELVSGRAGAIITGAQALRCQVRAKTSAVRLAAMQFFLQVIDATVYDHQQDSALFECLVGILERLDSSDEPDTLNVFRACQSDMLQVLGYGRFAPLTGGGRTDMDDAYERIAQRRLSTLALLYDVARTSFL